MKESLFENEIFDQSIYHDTKTHLMDIAEQLPDCLQALRVEGLPTTMEFFMTITDNTESFAEYIAKLREQRLKDSFIPIDERRRITESYADVYDRLRDSAIKLRRIRAERLPLLADGDAIVPDYDRIDAIAKEKATIHINVKKLSDYYDQVKKVIDSLNDLRAFQTSNGLPDVLTGGLTRVKGKYINQYDLQMLIDEGFTPELFADVARDHVNK